MWVEAFQQQYWHGREGTREMKREGGKDLNRKGGDGGGKAAISVIRRPALARH